MRMRLAVAVGCALAVVGAGAARARAEEPAKARQDRTTDPVVVTATRTPVPAGGVAGTVDVVTRAEIEAAAAPDVKAALSLVPTLVINDTGTPAGVATLSLRGATSMQTLVLLDGRRLANAQSSFFDLNMLPVPVERIERIEVVPTPASALYGADALGGVVNIVTRPVGTKPGLELALGGGSHGEWRTAGGAQAGIGAVGLRVDGQLRSGDGHRENGDYDLRTLAGSLRLEPAPWGLNVEWQYLDREAGAPGPDSFPTPSARQDDTRRSLRADFTYRPASSWDFTAGVSSLDQTMDYTDPAPPSFDPAFPAEPVASRHENRTLGADFQWDFDSGVGDFFTVGGEYFADGVDSTNDGSHDHDRWGVYAQDQWRSGGLSAVLAVRRDQHSAYGGETSPSISATWEAPGWRVWGSYARGYRAPNFDDLYWRDQYMVGNPDLQPETSWAWEAGAESRWGESGHLRAAYFSRRVENLIRWVDADGDYLYSPENVARARAKGFEAELLWRVTPGFSIPVGYQSLSTEDAETGEEVNGVVRSLWRAGAQYAAGAFTWALAWSRTDRGRFAYRDEAWRYATLDASVGWKGKVAGTPVRFSLRADNLRDREYETVEGFPMPGRTFFAEVGIGL